MAEIIKAVEVLNSQNLKTKIFKNKDCQFGYRESIFKKNKNLIIISATLKLKNGHREKIKKEILEILKKRKEKIPSGFSAGCIFKNAKYKIPRPFQARFAQRSRAAELKDFKKTGIIPAGWLIEKSGLKGKKIGEAKISEKHANFIINQNRAKAKDVFKLINLIKKKVKNKFGIKLEEEIELVGF